MAQMKAEYDYQFNKCSYEAKKLVEEWFNNNKLNIDFKTIYIVWFAFTKNGYYCVITSKTYPSNFFEISKNVRNNEIICRVLKQIGYIVHPSQAELISMHERVVGLLD